jgi:hypothetical protein
MIEDIDQIMINNHHFLYLINDKKLLLIYY